MTDALSGEKCIIISAVKPLLSHLISKVLVESEEDTDLTNEIKEDQSRSRIEIRMLIQNLSIYQSLLEEVEKQMLENVTNDQITTLSTSVETIDEDSEPLTKKSKGLSQILGHCHLLFYHLINK